MDVALTTSYDPADRFFLVAFADLVSVMSASRVEFTPLRDLAVWAAVFLPGDQRAPVLPRLRVVARRRKNTSGSVRKLPSGVWQARIHSADGVRTAVGTFALKAEADKALTLAVADQARGRYVDPRHGRVSFEQYAWSSRSRSRRVRPECV